MESNFSTTITDKKKVKKLKQLLDREEIKEENLQYQQNIDRLYN